MSSASTLTQRGVQKPTELAITNFCTSAGTEGSGFVSEPSTEKWPVTGLTGKLRCSSLIHHGNTIESVAVGLLGVRETKQTTGKRLAWGDSRA